MTRTGKTSSVTPGIGVRTPARAPTEASPKPEKAKALESSPSNVDAAAQAVGSCRGTPLRPEDAQGRAGATASVLAAQSARTKGLDGPTLRFGKYDGPSVTFPLSEADAQTLRSCNAVSPFVPNNPRVLVHPENLEPPTHPGDPGYWADLEKVVDVQIARAEGKDVRALLGDRVPKLFEGYTLEQAAEAVHADLPTDWPTALFKQFLAEGAKFDTCVIPQLSGSDFVNTLVLTSGVLGMATTAVSPSAFACKWHEGRARPEEAVWAIKQGKLTGAPARLREKIERLDLKSPESFTAYPEGAPRHPSWPAMHSAASISSMVLGVLFDLTPDQLIEARNLDYAVATFRTAAGVHFETDNLAGLEIGQQAMEKWLPDFLAQYAGADPDRVRDKIAKVRRNWDDHPELKLR